MCRNVSGRVDYVELDNLEGLRPGAGYDEEFADDFEEYAEGIAALAEPERALLRRWATGSPEANGYVTNGALRWIPEGVSEGGSWYEPRRAYEQAVRVRLTATNVVEVGCGVSAFSNGTLRIGLLPEDVAGEMAQAYAGEFLYAQMIHEPDGQVTFDLVRGEGTNRTWLAWTQNVEYVEGRAVRVQMDATQVRLYYPGFRS